MKKFAEWLLSKMLRGYYAQTVLADLDEEYEYILDTQGKVSANIWYIKQVINSIPHFINNTLLWGTTMFFNFLKVALRNFSKNKSITVINLFGLAVGMASAILIMFWVQNQFSYDKSQINRDNMVRLETETWIVQPPYFVEAIQDFPEIDDAVRFFFWFAPSVKKDDINFTLDDLAVTDTSIFSVFTFNFLAGNPNEAIKEPYSIVLTESIAKKLFGSENPIGKTVKLNESSEFNVTAIVADINDLHMNINGFISVYDKIRMGDKDFLTSSGANFSIYLQLYPNVNTDLLADKIYKKVTEVGDWKGDKIILRPFNDIYFASGLQYENNVKHGNYNLITVFIFIAVFILAIACINFVNLTIAKSTNREKEIAVRKVSGAGKSSIQWQVMGETSILVLFSFILSIAIVYLALPQFQLLTNEIISVDWGNSTVLLIMISTIIFTSILAGFYPAILLASKEPIEILKNRFSKKSSSAVLSKILITVQFAVAIILVISAVTVFKQLNFMLNKDLGANYEQIVTFRLRGAYFWGSDEKMLRNKATFRNTLLANPAIKGLTFTAQVPGEITNTWAWYVDNEDEKVELKIINANPDFINVMEIKLKEGRNLSFDNQSDFTNRYQTYIVNEETVRRLKLKDPLNTIIQPRNIQIVGVMEDFNYNSLHNKIEPIAIRWQSWNGVACVKISGVDVENTVQFLKKTFNDLCPGYTFEYDFLDQSFAKQYEAEKRLKEILSYFVFIAIILSTLGLFALTALFAEQKTKEIGIRKVLGSSVAGIIYFISKDFLIRVIIANLIAAPIAYFVIDSWLDKYAYRIEMSSDIFLISGGGAILIALATVFWQAYKAAKQNPVNSLKYE